MVNLASATSFATDRRLPVLGVIAQTLRIFGQAPALFLLLSLLPNLPSLIRIGLLGAGAQKFDLSFGVVILINMIFAYLVRGAITFAAYRLQTGERARFGESFGVGLRRFPFVLGTGLLVGIVVSFGMILLVVPGLIWACMFAVVVPACTIEALGPIESMKRSSALTRGVRWRIFGITLLFYLPLLVAGFGNALFVLRTGHVVESLVIRSIVTIIWTPLATILAVIMFDELTRLRGAFGVASIFA